MREWVGVKWASERDTSGYKNGARGGGTRDGGNGRENRAVPGGSLVYGRVGSFGRWVAAEGRHVPKYTRLHTRVLVIRLGRYSDWYM